MSTTQFHDFVQRIRENNEDYEKRNGNGENEGFYVSFEIEPHLRFKGLPGEQYTMFFYDPSGNALEFKAMTNPQNLFAKYEHIEK